MTNFENVAVLWDVENVTPDSDSLFIDGFLEYVTSLGNLSLANAFGNWTNPSISKLAKSLALKNFELFHIPKSRKNSADISMITKGIEIAFQYPKIDKFVLVTGDVDFRPLVIALRKQSKKIHIVCDVKTASEDLLSLADSFKDYRELIPSEYEGDSDDGELLELTSAKGVKKEEEIIRAYQKLVEAISIMKEENVKPGLGLVKIRMLMLNPSFDEKRLGFNIWSDFIGAAVEKGYITLQGKGTSAILEASKQKTSDSGQTEFLSLLSVLKELGKGNDEKFHHFPEVNKILIKKHNFFYKSAGYKKLRDFIQAAEKRDLVETKINGLLHSVRIRKKN